MLLTFKTTLASPKPYNSMLGEKYLALLEANKGNIYSGSFGVYLARMVVVNSQELYQPLIDIDGADGLEGQDRTISAITFAQATLKMISALGATDHFKFIATGGTGFRAVSNLLFNRTAYLAFVDWMRFEMPHLHDLNPSTQIDFPHQMFAYKGDPFQTEKALTDGHSTIIEKNLLAQSAFTLDDYLQITAGRPDPDEIIACVQWLIAGPVISDLKSIGPLGERIEQYQRIAADFKVNPFSYIQIRKDMEPVGLTAMQEMIGEKGLVSKIEKRGDAQAISFRGLQCPVCGKTTVNAWACPPNYQLRCFNIHCDAHNGMPLHRWAGIKNPGGLYRSSKNGFDLSVPDQHISLEDARDLIVQELSTRDDALIVVTPGAGKTHVSLEAISQIGNDHIVIYGAFNRDLQNEAYSKICELAGHSDGFYFFQPREQTCLRPAELKNITDRGFSPSEILCSRCEYRDTVCEYYSQRRDFGPGVYFVTLHMLQYLQDRIPTPDLIILDENVKAGLMLEDSCSELQMKSVLMVVNGTDAVIVRHLLNIVQQISTKLVDTGGHPMIINGRKMTDANNQETTIIELLAKRMNMTDEDMIDSLSSLSKSLDSLSRTNLFRQEIDLNAITWIQGLTSPSTLSFVHIAKNGDVKFSIKRITRIGLHDTPIKILDATGDANAYGALLNRKLKTVRADVTWNSNRVHIKINTSRKTMQFSREPNLTKLLIEMLSYTKSQHIMVVTYMKNEKNVLDILSRIDPTRKFMGYHFMGPRGINSYQGCDAVLAIGLPYPNLNSAAQDACILFPRAKDADKRMEWTEACMQWDFVQSIHRIRPVHKSSVDIILAANRWPSMLQTPDVVIDRSQNANWKELAIQRLKPFVEDFGFLNQDIGFLANVYVKSKDTIAKRFQVKISRLIHDVKDIIPELKGNHMTSQLFGSEEISSSGYTCLKDDDELAENEKIKLILALKELLNQNSLEHKKLYARLVNLIQKQSIVWTNEDIILSNPNQWSVLLNHFKETNPHFEKFEIKLPHARGNAVIGVGNPDRVRDFYGHIDKLGVVGRVDIDTYQPVEACMQPVNPIPAGLVSICIPEDQDTAYVGVGSEFKAIPLNAAPGELRACFEGIVAGSDITIVTNDGKQVAKAFLSCGLQKCKIIDVVIAEKLIANGEVEYRALSLKTVFSRYEMPDGMEKSGVVHRLTEIWSKQEPLIQSAGLETVFGIETRLIWVTAGIEAAGIGIDVDTLLQLHDDLGDKIDTLAAELEKSIPPDIPLHDRGKIQEYLNSTYALKLAKIDEESMQWISNADVRRLVGSLIEYWKAGRERRNVESYMAMTGDDDRVRDSIEQLNTKTGRFYRHLQTVQKNGPMRSLFCARDGYKFVVADYSQQEARIIAGLSIDAAAIALFESGKDIYLETAKAIVGDRLKASRLRALGKEIVLGLNNGRSAYSIYDGLARLGFGYDLDDVQGMILRYNMEFSGMKAWRDGIESSAVNDGCVSTPLGRRLKVNKDTNPNSLINYPVQGTAADGFKMALIRLEDELIGKDARIVHILHDEVIVDAREDIAATVAMIIQDCMEQAFKGILPEVPMVVEPVVRDSWE
ncbi:hypothetical protein DSCW_35960 [Desulfosarcina widdelii]|uniref:DNA-directed DNA polymerase n=1 Tax=Desulfosarcina widdelii TaxID=947919 RepID=A0A5K7Z7P3_9BACT|nr:DNA polymerase [Desulfosarcina widdelii]BBO76179.1 hypothetical protein DSCW_35960 [Desulfosarcina widdelii]